MKMLGVRTKRSAMVAVLVMVMMLLFGSMANAGTAEGLMSVLERSQVILSSSIDDIDAFSSGRLTQNQFLNRVRGYREQGFDVFVDMLELENDGTVTDSQFVDTTFVVSNLYLVYNLMEKALESGDVEYIDAAIVIMNFNNSVLSDLTSSLK